LVPFSSFPVQAQTIESRLDSLQINLEKFEYQKVLREGEKLLKLRGLTKNDSLLILEYSLNAAFALDDSQKVVSNMKEILECSETYSLNPKITSPKIINEFEEFKKVWNLARESAVTVDSTAKSGTIREPIPTQYLISNLLIPGTGHLWIGAKKKGTIFSIISGVTITNIIYFTFETKDNRDAYMAAKNGAEFDELYDRYNRSYKTRNTLLLAYALLSIYSFYDLYTDSINKNGTRLSVKPKPYTVSVELSFSIY
jgi:hypothetical protein